VLALDCVMVVVDGVLDSVGARECQYVLETSTKGVFSSTFTYQTVWLLRHEDSGYPSVARMIQKSSWELRRVNEVIFIFEF
jgi:hypothetical protein